MSYWSATGNTALAVRLAAEALRETGAEVATEFVATADRDLIPPCDLWVVAAPVFAFRAAIPLQDYLRRVRAPRGTRAAAILTHGGMPDRAATYLARQLRRAGAEPWRCVDLECEDSWTVLRGLAGPKMITGEPSSDKRERFREWWRSVPDRLARGVPSEDWRRPVTPLTAAGLFYTKPLLRIWFYIRVDMEKCIFCGKCEQRCPTGRMKTSNFPRPRGDCVGCYACVNVCPVDAVDTWLTHGAPRYRGPADTPSEPKQAVSHRSSRSSRR